MNPYEGKICPACNQPITENDAVAVCGECNAPQHLSCWQKKQGCSTEGCVGQIKEVFEPENGEDPEQNTEAPETAEAPTDISENETTKSKKKKRMIAVAGSCSAVAVIAAGILFTVLFAIPFSKYKKASSMLEEGKYDAAYTDFRELDGFLQSEEKSNEALYRKAKELKELGEYQKAEKIFRELGSYSDSESLRCESIYEYADKVSDFSMKQAYLAYAEIPDYRDVAEKKNEILKKWITRSVENGNVNDFFASVKLNRAEERLCLRAVLDLLADETSRSVKAMSPVICDFLSSVSDVDGSLDDLKRFFEDLRDTENFKDFIRSDRAYIYMIWNRYEFIPKMMLSDDCIVYFLEGTWFDSYSFAYLQFIKNDNGETRCITNLSRIKVPKNAVYYDIKDMTLFFEDEDGNRIVDVFKFTINSSPYDMQVYCCEDGNTYDVSRN